MRLYPSVWVLATIVLAAGCAKPLAPDTGVGADPSQARGARVSVASPSFGVQLAFVGSIVTLDRDGRPRQREETFHVTGPTPAGAAIDTIPAYAVLRKVTWRPTTAMRGRVASPAAREAAPDMLPAAPAIGEVFPPGFHELVLHAPDHAGGGEVHVRFWSGFTPSTWWAGPDPSRWPTSSDGDGRAVDVTDWSRFATLPAWPPDGRGYFGPDSLGSIPSSRRPPGDDLERRTFYEIFGDRIYARSEGDVVHEGAWIVLCNGGFDKDSPYVPRVDASDPALPPDFASHPELYPVLQPQGLVGSPIGFRSQLTMKLPDGSVFRLPTSGLYPVFEPASPFRLTQVAGHLRAERAGTAYVVVRAEDSDGLRDGAVDDPIGLVARVDAGGGTPADRIARRRVLVFQVAPAPDAPMARATSGVRR